MSISVINKSHRAIDVAYAPHKMMVFMESDREISFPLAWFSPVGRCHYRVTEQLALYWQWRRHTLAGAERRYTVEHLLD